MLKILALLAAAQAGIWLDVPFVAQQTNGCGSASIAMVLRYWSRHGRTVKTEYADPERIQQALYSRKAGGIFASDMVRYFEEHGFRTFVFKAGWRDLEEHLAKGRPLVVCLGKLGSGALHYAVVAGMEPRRGLVLVNDPARRKLAAMDNASFERAWGGAGNWTLLAVPAPNP